MALPGTDTGDSYGYTYDSMMWSIATITIIYIAVESGIIMALIAIGLIVAIVAICVAGYGVKRLVEHVRMNALTHTEEWQDERFRTWVLRELEPACKKVGHEYLFDNTCFWCGHPSDHDVSQRPNLTFDQAVARDRQDNKHIDPPTESVPLTSWDDYYAHAAAVEAHYRGEDEPIPELPEIESEDVYTTAIAEHNKQIANVFLMPPNLPVSKNCPKHRPVDNR